MQISQLDRKEVGDMVAKAIYVCGGRQPSPEDGSELVDFVVRSYGWLHDSDFAAAFNKLALQELDSELCEANPVISPRYIGRVIKAYRNPTNAARKKGNFTNETQAYSDEETFEVRKRYLKTHGVFRYDACDPIPFFNYITSKEGVDKPADFSQWPFAQRYKFAEEAMLYFVNERLGDYLTNQPDLL